MNRPNDSTKKPDPKDADKELDDKELGEKELEHVSGGSGLGIFKDEFVIKGE
jgi:bacteriocin-like protein